jgi:exo-beta-1,3-glucanase (GH17 family)
MPKAVSLFTLTAGIIVAVWWWLGAAVPMPPSPLDPGEKLYCISYAPFRGAQTPLDLATRIEPRQIEEDLALLSRLTDCVRTYSVDFGLDRVPEIARRHGLKVMLGLWVSSHADRTKLQIDTGTALAKQFPDTIRAVIVGNEALLRGEIAPAALADLVRSVKAQVSMPVTYADVWEFWLRYRELASAVDFITIHILPYWEDHPIAAAEAANHVASIRRHVVAEFANKEVMIGEVGWPSAGRMREGALPSSADQARVLHDVLEQAKRENFRVNIIEAFDQPWKRYLEGTVGGHWGLIKDSPRDFKFAWGTPVSNHPDWRWQALGGVGFAALVFGGAWLARGRAGTARDMPAGAWALIALNAAIGGVLVGWTVADLPVESLGWTGWLRSVSFAIVGIAAPLVGAAALALRIPVPVFAHIIGPQEERVHGRLAMALGVLSIALTVLALQATLGLVFDPRYRDFPFAPLTAAVVPFGLLSFCVPRPLAVRPAAESAAAAVLALSAIYIVWNETTANWQALWFSAALVLLALTLARARIAPG